MNNFQFWLTLIIIVITLIARARKKTQPVERQSPERPSPPQPREETGQKPMTFEELLREIQAAKTPDPKPVSSQPQVVDYDDEIEDDEKSQERTEYNFPQKQETYALYEKAKEEAFHRPSLEETLKLKDTIVRFGQFKGYQHEEKTSQAAEIAKELRKPSSFKKAFIMSEILMRRF